jgi:hypothetical protein
VEEKQGENLMGSEITVADLWPLVRKLPRVERVRLARLALGASGETGRSDAEAYKAAPPSDGEFGSDDAQLSWEPEGWEEFDATR